MRSNFLVWTFAYPGMRDISLAVLLKTVDQFAQAIAKKPASARAPRTHQVPEYRTQTAWLSIRTGIGSIAGVSPDHLCELVAVLVASHRDETEQRRH
jgi:hypothetical protein